MNLPTYLLANSKIKRLLITGGSSYVGQHLVPLAVTAGYDVCHTFFSTDVINDGRSTPLDIRDEQAVHRLLTHFQPDAVIHLAGSNRSPDMETLITKGAQHIAQTSQKLGARLIHMSTDVIFDGRAAPYQETDLPAPLHPYGRAKAASEQIVVDHHKSVAVIRPSLIYGLEIIDRGTEWVSQSLAAGEPVTLFTNQWRTPIWVETLCQSCLELLHHTDTTIYHLGGNQQLSRAQFGLRLLDWWDITQRNTLTIAPTPANAPWPPNTSMNNDKAKADLQTPIYGVDDVLAMFPK